MCIKLFEHNWRSVAEGEATEIRYAVGKDFKTLLLTGIDILSIWHGKLADDNYRILSIEEPFSFDIPGLPIPLIGAIDLVEEDESGNDCDYRLEDIGQGLQHQKMLTETSN